MWLWLQAERDAKRYTAFEKKAGLTAQAERLKTSMKESQLVNFRAETKSRYALHFVFYVLGTNMGRQKKWAPLHVDPHSHLLSTTL